MPKLTWKNGSPLDFAICAACKAPIVRGQLEHECAGSCLTEEARQFCQEATGFDSRIAAQQAEMVAEVEARLNDGPLKVGERVRLSAEGLRQFNWQSRRTGVVTREARWSSASPFPLIGVRRTENRSSTDYAIHFWERDPETQA